MFHLKRRKIQGIEQAKQVAVQDWVKLKAIAGFGLSAFAAALSVLGYQYINLKQTHEASLRYQQQFETEYLEQESQVKEKLEQLAQAKVTIKELESYLTDRGVKIKPSFEETDADKPNPAAGGPLEHFEKNDLLAIDMIEQLDTLDHAIRRIPIGYPHHGKITSTFGNRSNPFSGKGSESHGGTDFKGNIGDAVKTTANGRVIHAGTLGGYGNLVQVQHGFGYVTYYAHLSAVDVKVGQRVNAGDVIGKLGSTGRSTGPHLHYEVRKNDERLDPVQFLTFSS